MNDKSAFFIAPDDQDLIDEFAKRYPGKFASDFAKYYWSKNGIPNVHVRKDFRKKIIEALKGLKSVGWDWNKIEGEKENEIK